MIWFFIGVFTILFFGTLLLYIVDNREENEKRRKRDEQDRGLSQERLERLIRKDMGRD